MKMGGYFFSVVDCDVFFDNGARAIDAPEISQYHELIKAKRGSVSDPAAPRKRHGRPGPEPSENGRCTARFQRGSVVFQTC